MLLDFMQSAATRIANDLELSVLWLGKVQACPLFSALNSKPKITSFLGGRLPCPIAIIVFDAS